MTRRSADRADILRREIAEIEKEIEGLQRQIAAAADHRNELASILRKKCRHTRIVQFGANIESVVDHQGCFGSCSHFEARSGPMRFCLNCGEAEPSFSVAKSGEFVFDRESFRKEIEGAVRFSVLTRKPALKIPHERLNEFANITLRQANALVRGMLREQRSPEKEAVAGENAAT